MIIERIESILYNHVTNTTKKIAVYYLPAEDCDPADYVLIRDFVFDPGAKDKQEGLARAIWEAVQFDCDEKNKICRYSLSAIDTKGKTLQHFILRQTPDRRGTGDATGFDMEPTRDGIVTLLMNLTKSAYTDLGKNYRDLMKGYEETNKMLYNELRQRTKERDQLIQALDSIQTADPPDMEARRARDRRIDRLFNALEKYAAPALAKKFGIDPELAGALQEVLEAGIIATQEQQRDIMSRSAPAAIAAEPDPGSAPIADPPAAPPRSKKTNTKPGEDNAT